MNNYWRNLGRLAAVAACGWMIGWGNPSTAQISKAESPTPPGESSVLSDQSTGQPQLVPALPTTPESIQPVPPSEELAPPADGVVVHPVAQIDYDVTHRARKRFGGSPFVELSMVTQNPADGCFYEIPLCLPACCTGEPQMTSYCGLFGRGVVVYCYECGLEIEVKFRLRGDVEVEYGT